MVGLGLENVPDPLGMLSDDAVIDTFNSAMGQKWPAAKSFIGGLFGKNGQQLDAHNGKPLKTIGHSHADSLKRIGEASLLEEGAEMIAPYKRKRRTIAVDPSVRDLFRLTKSESWPAMMEKYLGLDPGSYSTFTPPVPGRVPKRRTRTVANEPTTPSNNQGPSVCGNCKCLECSGHVYLP